MQRSLVNMFFVQQIMVWLLKEKQKQNQKNRPYYLILICKIVLLNDQFKSSRKFLTLYFCTAQNSRNLHVLKSSGFGIRSSHSSRYAHISFVVFLCYFGEWSIKAYRSKTKGQDFIALCHRNVLITTAGSSKNIILKKKIWSCRYRNLINIPSEKPLNDPKIYLKVKARASTALLCYACGHVTLFKGTRKVLFSHLFIIKKKMSILV